MVVLGGPGSGDLEGRYQVLDHDDFAVAEAVALGMALQVGKESTDFHQLVHDRSVTRVEGWCSYVAGSGRFLDV